MLHVKHKRWSWFAFGIGSCSNAPKFRQLAQAPPQLFIFRQMGKRAGIVLKVTDQPARKILPTMKLASAMRAKDQFKQVRALVPGCGKLGLLLGLEKNDRGLVPGVKIPETIQRMRRIRGIQNQQFRQVAQIQQRALYRIIVDLPSGKAGKSLVKLLPLSVGQL